MTLSTATAVDDESIDVVDGSKFVVGAHIQVDTETLVVESVDGNSLLVSTDVQNAHAAGITVQILPDTLLWAIRNVQIRFTAIAPRPDAQGGSAPVGQVGRATSHGMNYRTVIFERTIDLFNQRTVALNGTP